MKEEESGPWLKKHLQASYEPLLEEAWALDVDTTVKPLYGHQEDAKVGYNPPKPGRPSHAFHRGSERAYLFKLKQNANVKKPIARLLGNDQWSQARRVVVLRRPLRKGLEEEKKRGPRLPANCRF